MKRTNSARNVTRNPKSSEDEFLRLFGSVPGLGVEVAVGEPLVLVSVLAVCTETAEDIGEVTDVQSIVLREKGITNTNVPVVLPQEVVNSFGQV